MAKGFFSQLAGFGEASRLVLQKLGEVVQSWSEVLRIHAIHFDGFAKPSLRCLRLSNLLAQDGQLAPSFCCFHEVALFLFQTSRLPKMLLGLLPLSRPLEYPAKLVLGDCFHGWFVELLE